MSRACRAVVAFSLLASPQLLIGQTPDTGAQRSVPPWQVGSTQSSNSSVQVGAEAPRSRTPRQEEELRADILMARKEYGEAIPVYQDLLHQDPRNAGLLNKIGVAYHQQAMLDQAKRYYERAVKADRTFAVAYNNIGTVYYQRKNYRKAIRAYNKAVALRQDIAAVYSNLAYAHFAQKQFEEAMAAFRRALELDPGVLEHSHSAGSLLQDRSVRDRGLLYFFLAKSFAQMGNAERCAEYLRKARDEGYKEWASARTDPAFAPVLHAPSVQEVFELDAPSGETVRRTPPGPPGS